jgi:hypothetical protein
MIRVYTRLIEITLSCSACAQSTWRGRVVDSLVVAWSAAGEITRLLLRAACRARPLGILYHQPDRGSHRSEQDHGLARCLPRQSLK